MTAIAPGAETGEIARLNRVIEALMDRAERSTTTQGSDFSLFQNTVMLDERVRARTLELDTALRENERITRALQLSEARFRGIVNQSLVGIAIVEQGRFTYTNPKLEEIFGYDAREMSEMSWAQLTAPEDVQRVTDAVRKRQCGEIDQAEYTFRGLRKGGAPIDLDSRGSSMEVDGRRMVVSLVMDITERTRNEHAIQALQTELRELATHDALTGLYNRRFLEQSLKRELLLSQRQGHPVSAIMADLDWFKRVNDEHGHLAGDAVLQAFAGLLQRLSRGSDICCRWGGEEFLLILPGMSMEDALKRAELMRSALACAPVHYGDSIIAVTASFGVASFPANAASGDGLIAAADDALYSAKRSGRNRVEAAG